MTDGRDDWGDEDDRPRRRRDPDDWDEEDDYRDRRAAARAKVQGPGVALMVYGILLLVLSVFAACGAAWAIADLTGGPPKKHADREDETILAVCLAVGAVFGLACGPIIAFGGAQMRSLRSWGWALTATVCAFVFGMLFCILLALLPIWPLIVLVDPQVKREFDRRRRD